MKLIEDNQCVIIPVIIACKETDGFSDDTSVKVQLRYVYVWVCLVFFTIDKLLIVSVLDLVWYLGKHLVQARSFCERPPVPNW